MPELTLNEFVARTFTCVCTTDPALRHARPEHCREHRALVALIIRYKGDAGDEVEELREAEEAADAITRP